MKSIFFIFVDHFEPEGEPDPRKVMELWSREYPLLAGEHRDCIGNPPRHTWFYSGREQQYLRGLADLCRHGYGEVECHLHHGYDNETSLKEKINNFKKMLADTGLRHGPPDLIKYGFIHGKWSLDNSRGDQYCGVNNELKVLAETGCYADFTFPAWGRMQPKKINSIYYALDIPDRPKSYDQGQDVHFRGSQTGDLMLVQGPGNLSGFPERVAKHQWLYSILNKFHLTCGVDVYNPPSLERISRWINAGVGVKGFPDWIFVKIHTHGARTSFTELLSNGALAVMYDHLEDTYNDNQEYQLYYVTARQAYNLVKALESGYQGEPGGALNFLLPPYGVSG